ncbi:MAG: serine hydrolase domain-containing protein [bacterium]
MHLKALVKISWVLLWALYCQGVAASEARVSNLEQFIDGIMAQAIVQGETVGATVSLVQDGRLLVSRGYGYADYTRREPVQSRVTQFQIGSISKVWVWIAVLQLVEAGNLDLDRDINSYLDTFQIPDTMGDPVTLRHLMTHSAGFEDQLFGLFVSGPRQVGNLADTLAAHLPRRVTLPGTRVAYSNYGAALAGHIVELAAGMRFSDYVQQHIFKPLDMASAGIAQTLDNELLQTRSKGYVLSQGEPQERGALYIPLGPAGAGAATALDMAKFMVELLNPRDTKLLSSASKAQLINGAYVHHPLVNGLTMGMFQTSRGDAAAVGHDGSTLIFNAQMVLWPDADMGLFVATNTLGSDAVGRRLVATVSNHLGFDNRSDRLSPVESAAGLPGTYIGSRRNFSSASKLLGLLDTVTVSHEADQDALSITRAQGQLRYRGLTDDVFQQVAGSTRAVFKTEGGVGQELYFSDVPPIAYIRAEPMEVPLNNALFLLLWLLVALSVLIVWPVSAFTHKGHDGVQGQRLATVVAYAGVALAVIFFLQVAAQITSPVDVVLNLESRLMPLLWLPLVVALLTLVQFLQLYRVLVRGAWWVSRRIHYVLVLAMQMALVYWFWYWNLLPPMLLG